MDLLDTGQLAALYDLAGRDTGDMVEDFAATCRGTLRELEELLHAGAAAEAADLAHQMKGGAATVGFAAFGQQAAAWETGLRQGQLPAVTQVATLSKLLEDSVVEVQRILASRAG